MTQFVSFAIQMAEVVCHLHNDLHILHGDLQPSAWLVNNDWLLLTDFGRATIFEQQNMRAGDLKGDVRRLASTFSRMLSGVK